MCFVFEGTKGIVMGEAEEKKRGLLVRMVNPSSHISPMGESSGILCGLSS